MTARRAWAGGGVGSRAGRPRPWRPVPLPRDGPRRLYPALAAARRTCAARLWTLRPEPLPASLLLPGRTRKSSSPTVMSTPQLELPSAHILQIGRAECVERVWPYVSILVVAVSLKKKKYKQQNQ